MSTRVCPAICTLIALAAFFLHAAAGAEGESPEAPGSVISLDSAASVSWLVAPDKQNIGRDESWWTQPAPDAKPARVPGIVQETFPRHHGVSWYWCTFECPANPRPQGRALLRFWAVDYLADVWVNDSHVGGHEGGETPFVLDVTDAVRPGEPNRLAVRVLNPSNTPVDGFVLAETPHRNNTEPLRVGAGIAHGGITESVELILAPAVRVEDVFVRPDWKTGVVRVLATVHNGSAASVAVRVALVIAPAMSGNASAAAKFERELPVGDTLIEAELVVQTHRLWSLDEPNLYRLETRVDTGALGGDEHAVRFGFRDFRVDRGYFRLNGKRIFVRSSHTGNHCPVSQILPPDEARDLLRKDLIYAKASGFNMVRFIAGVAHPYQLDLCDEIGLMVYEENYAGWCLADSPKMAERFDFSTREMIRRDRNHPCVTIWGLMNETPDGPVFRHAVDSLALVRSLDDTRLTLLGSGRWDGQFNIGSLSNPGSAAWECQWGVESPDYVVPPGSIWSSIGGYITNAGDAHVYPSTPHTAETEHFIRTLGSGTKPVFLSEYGIGSLMNAVRELRAYEQRGFSPELEDMQHLQATVDKFTADWTRFGMESVYAFPEGMLRDSQRLHCRQRVYGFDLIRSNPKICGFNLTGLLDHGYTGEGLWTFWREWKPGIVDALQDGWAPLRWCLFASPMHGYVNRPFKLEAVLANEDVLAPGEYAVTLRVLGPAGVSWEQQTMVRVAQPNPGEDGPLAIPVFSGEVTLAGPAGQYEFAVDMANGGAPAGGRLKFYLSDIGVRPAASRNVVVWGIDDRVRQWLSSRGVVCGSLAQTMGETPQVILVGDVSASQPDAAAWRGLMARVARGSVVVFLAPHAFKRDDAVGWLPLVNKGRGNEFPDWLYHKECVAKAHPVLEGLQSRGVMDWEYYGPVIPHYFFEGQDAPDELAIAAFALCHSAPPGGYAAGIILGSYRFGQGLFTLNSLNIVENVDRHPAADRLLLNLIEYAAAHLAETAGALPADFDQTLAAIRY